jgi:hypothetical protein
MRTTIRQRANKLAIASVPNGTKHIRHKSNKENNPEIAVIVKSQLHPSERLHRLSKEMY